jgi:prepilin-type N-terminal cleavage/methylation domain-containing protein
MKAERAAGFTLIELLTVIAIIAILAGLTAVVLPGVLERAKIADVEADLKAISTSLHGYYTEHGTYPPAYGYELFDPETPNPAVPTYNTHPYTVEAGIEDAFDAYDRFSANNYDTNFDNQLGMLEFLPIRGDGFFDLPLDQLPYQGGQPVSGFPLQSVQKRPYIYIPYAKGDIERMHRIAGANWDGATWNANFMTANTIYPPAQYDAFVLIGVGPLRNTRGIVTPPGNEAAWLASTGETLPRRAYYILGMRAAYLATRDADGDKTLDFDYRSRRAGQAKAHPTMPDGRTDLGFAAPIIETSN